ncbi:MAG: hypothetical protein KA247_00265 [Bacteroidetes bacterium]|nr:hypothetical protein [Bacteroidota bacterium]
MTTEATASKGGLEWKWIITGILAGTALCLSLYLMIAKTFHIPLIPTFMSLLGFVVMGIIIGFKSEGYTLKEPAIGGFVTLLLVGVILSAVFGVTFTTTELIAAPIIGLILGLIGGWAGEQIQITPEELVKELEADKKGGLQWGWILAGTVIAFIFNAFFVIGGFALLKFGMGGLMISLGASFLFAGLLVGYFSPGVTIMEAGIAGVLSVILNALFLYTFSLLMMDEMLYVVELLVGGFVLSLVGGWLGEKLQVFMENDTEHE